MKPVVFFGNSLGEVRRAVGFQIDRLQRGLDPDDWKPMKAIGAGVREIRVRDATGAYRVIYIASLAAAVYILLAFQKQSQAAPKRELETATVRYKDLMRRTGR